MDSFHESKTSSFYLNMCEKYMHACHFVGNWLLPFSRFERIKALEVIIWKSQSNGNVNVKFQIHLFVSKSADCLTFFYHCRFTTTDPDLDAKRALQDFSLLHQCLTNELWQTIWNLQHYQKEEGVLNYAFDLGLRCPSGSTIQCMTALIHLVDMKSLSAGELYIRQRKAAKCQMPFVP